MVRLTEILYVPRRMVDADKNISKNMCFQHPNTAPKP